MEGEDVESKTILIRHQWDCDGRERQKNNTTQPRPPSALIVAHRALLKQFRAAKKRLHTHEKCRMAAASPSTGFESRLFWRRATDRPGCRCFLLSKSRLSRCWKSAEPRLFWLRRGAILEPGPGRAARSSSRQRPPTKRRSEILFFQQADDAALTLKGRREVFCEQAAFHMTRQEKILKKGTHYTMLFKISYCMKCGVFFMLPLSVFSLPVKTG